MPRKAALVTGAASGIGRSAVLALARAGYDVAINYSRSEAAAREVAADAEKLGARTLLCRCDVASDTDVRAMLTAVEAAFGRLDVLINNAGMTSGVNPKDFEACAARGVSGNTVRIIDLHCYPNTEPWIRCQGPYVEALAKYWKRAWTWKQEDEVVKEFADAGVEAVLVALDLETTTHTPPCTNEYVKGMQLRHRERIIHAWAAVDPFKGEIAIQQASKAIKELGMLGFHFHPIMGHFAVNDHRLYPLFEVIDALKVPVMIDVGTTGMGAGMPGGLGARIRHAHPSAIDDLAADFPGLTIIAAHPGWPWTDEMAAVALHKGNVYWELSGWAPKYFPAQLKVDIRARLQDKVMFGSDYPSIPYARLFKEWRELGYPDALMEKIYHENAERILGL